MWNGEDDRLKERLFGLTNPEGNHGEDAKEYWWHLDATPTHSYAEYLYRYPHRAFPYDELVAQNAERPRSQGEFELSDTGILAEDRFFDVVVTHAKAAPTDIVMTITATNHGPEPAPLHLVPQLWFRNTWAWGRDDRRPLLRLLHRPQVDEQALVAVEAQHEQLGRYVLTAAGSPGSARAAHVRQRVRLRGPVGSPQRVAAPEGRRGPRDRPRRPLGALDRRHRHQGGLPLPVRRGGARASR